MSELILLRMLQIELNFNIFNMIFKIDVNFKIVEYAASDVIDTYSCTCNIYVLSY